jgi:pilus assembly protein CpaB
MSPRNIILIAIALIAAVGTALMARNWINAERAALAARQKTAPVQASQYVLVAKANLPAGRFVKAEDFRWQAWPDGPLPPAYIVKGKRQPEQLAGAVVRSGIAADEPITDARLVKPGDQGFMAAVLKPGFRAVSVSVNATSGIAGFVFPGDRVDLLVTHKVATGEMATRKSALVTETVLRDVQVVAIDQRTDDQNSTPIVARTVTFEVTPKQAEMVNVARRLGEMTLSLRSLGREEAQGELASLVLEEGDAALPEETSAAPDASLKIEPTEPTIAEGRFTIDNEVSRLLGGIGGEVQKVTIVRGDKSKVQNFRNGMAESEQSLSDSSNDTSSANGPSEEAQ